MTLDPLAPPATRRGRAWLRVRRWGRRATTDPAYPSAVARALIAATVLLALLVTFAGVERVLDRLESRATYGECVDDREAAWEVAISDLILADPDSTAADVYAELVDRLTVANEAQRNIDNPPAEGGCPGRQHVDGDAPPPSPPPTYPTITPATAAPAVTTPVGEP